MAEPAADRHFRDEVEIVTVSENRDEIEMATVANFRDEVDTDNSEISDPNACEDFQTKSCPGECIL